MNKRIIVTAVFLCALIWNTTAYGDVIKLKNGLVLTGKFKGGTEKTIKFETSGAVQEIAVSELESIVFSGAQTGKTAAAVVPAGQAEVIPAGTKILVKTSQPISTAQHKAGATIEAVLDADLVVNGVTVAPKGSRVLGTVVESVGGRRIGLQRIVVKFDRLMIDGKSLPIETEEVGAEGGRGSAAKMIGAGALFGAAGGDAGKGAAIGAGLALLAGGKHIQIPAGSKVELTIRNPVKLR